MLIAVDTNVLMDLAREWEPAWDAISLIPRRIPHARLVVLPTVIQELTFISRQGDTAEDRQAAHTALVKMRPWGFDPANFLPVERVIVERLSMKLRQPNLLPDTELNDAFILAEAALLGCGLFVTSDTHFLELDRESLALELKAADVSAPVITSPRDIVRRFCG